MGHSKARPLISVEDSRTRAKRRIPKFAFDFVDGGAGAENGLRRNIAAFRQELLQPFALVNTDREIVTKRSFLGKDWAVPFGVAPMGLAGLAWAGIDQHLAVAAEQAGAPYVASTPSTASLETLKKLAPRSGWFQLYVGRSEEIVQDLITRADTAGYDTLVVTADVPRPGKRRRDLRNKFGLPLKMGPGMLADIACCPAWAMNLWRQGVPGFANLSQYAEPGASTSSLAELMASQSSGRLDWDLLQKIRQRWTGKLVLKGISAPENVVQAMKIGIDAVIVSNHGGRQLDGAPATLDALKTIRAEVGDDVPLAVDGGVRSGEDILKACNAGADFVFLGRPFIYAVGANGPAGAAQIFDMLKDELINAMVQTGRPVL